jgi:hypothetical protein
VTSAFTVSVEGDHRPLNIRAGSEIFAVRADIESDRNVVRIAIKEHKGYIEVPRESMIRYTRR